MKLGFKKGLAAVLTCALVLGMGMETSAAGTRVADDGTMVSLVNQFRATGADCDQVGFMGPSGALTVDSYLTELAMQRAEEIAVSFSHTRPDGTMVTTSGLSEGENIAMGTSMGASGAFQIWKEDGLPYAQQGHRRNMLDSGYVAIGIGHVRYNGADYWVQEFGRSIRGGQPEQPSQPEQPEQPSAPQYSFTAGAGSTWVPGSSDPLVITCDGDFSKFTGITISGVDIDPSWYDAWSGSTVISLKPEFLNSLSLGMYTLRVNYTDGAAETNFTINTDAPVQDDTTTGTNGNNTNATNSTNKSPQTGEHMTKTQSMPGMTVVVSLLVLLAAASIVTGMKLRKRV